MNMSVMTQPFMKYVNLALSYVEDARLAQALSAGFVENEERLARYANTYRRITSHHGHGTRSAYFFVDGEVPMEQLMPCQVSSYGYCRSQKA